MKQGRGPDRIAGQASSPEIFRFFLQQQGVSQSNNSTRTNNRDNTHLEFEQGNKCGRPYQSRKPFKRSFETLRPKYMVGKKDRQIQNNANHGSGYTC